jgi:hypothetical protein
MKTYTPNAGFEKDDDDEFYDIATTNRNLDKMDGMLGDLSGMDIMCGTFEERLSDLVDDPVVVHNADEFAHRNMIADGSSNATATDISESLEEHMNNPNAHQNLNIDGSDR